MANKLVVRLGQSPSALPMTAAPDHGVKIIGTVHRGAEFGYLALSPAGEYMQVNGSVTRVLNASKVRAAIRSAEVPRGRQRPTFQRPTFQRSAAPPERPPAVVIVRKKRRVLAAAGDV